MASFMDNDITNAGLLVIAKGQIGRPIEFTRIVLGDGYLPEGAIIRDLEDVINAVVTVEINKLVVVGNGSAVVGGYFSNADLDAGFYYRELALYAEDPDVGEVLYCYGNAQNLAEWIPPTGSSSVVEKSIDIVTSIGTALNVTAELTSAIYATRIEVEELRVELGTKVDADDYTKLVPYAGTTTGAANAYTISSPAITELKPGMAVAIRIHADSSAASTLNWSGTGNKAIKKANGSDMTNLKVGSIYTLRYDGVNFCVQGEGGSGNATAADILIGKTASVDAGDIIGTMPNRAGDTPALASAVSGTTLKLLTSDGYRNGESDFVTITDEDFIAENIVEGIDIFGVTGITQRRNFAINNSSYSSPTLSNLGGYPKTWTQAVTVAGLEFTPTQMFCVANDSGDNVKLLGVGRDHNDARLYATGYGGGSYFCEIQSVEFVPGGANMTLYGAYYPTNSSTTTYTFSTFMFT